MATTPVDQPHADTFDASSWLIDWAENGGIVLVVHEHLYLRRSPRIGSRELQKLDQLRARLLRSGGGPAIADVLIRRRNGDLP